MRRVGSATGFLLQDGLGSVRGESQTGSGTTNWRDYGPYGMPSNDNGLTAANGRGYINERFDPETGLQYLHARYYDSHLGRFLSPNAWDPTIPEVDFNRYSYSLNDPINGSAPLGRLHVAELDANGSQLSLRDTVRESGKRETSYTAAGPKAGQMQYEAMLNLAPSRLLTKPKTLRPDPKLVEALRKKEEAAKKKAENLAKAAAKEANETVINRQGGESEGTGSANQEGKGDFGDDGGRSKEIEDAAIVATMTTGGSLVGQAIGQGLTRTSVGGTIGAAIGGLIGGLVGTVITVFSD